MEIVHSKNIKNSQYDKDLLLVHDNGFLNVNDFTVKQYWFHKTLTYLPV